jgi:UTP--glucose-1-phosphate uridylyltransferase
MLGEGKPLYGRMLEGEWLDTGDKLGFLQATIHYGLKHPEVNVKLRKYLANLDIS